MTDLSEIIKNSSPNLSKQNNKKTFSFHDFLHNKTTPIQINEEIRRIAHKQTCSITYFEVKGYALFNWFEHNMDYEDTNELFYRTSIQAFNDRKGNCIEQAFLYIALARCAGLKSYLVDVKNDYSGKNVEHACASLVKDDDILERQNCDVNKHKIILVDTAYHTYDIRHKDVRIMDELGVRMMYLKIRV